MSADKIKEEEARGESVSGGMKASVDNQKGKTNLSDRDASPDEEVMREETVAVAAAVAVAVPVDMAEAMALTAVISK